MIKQLPSTTSLSLPPANVSPDAQNIGGEQSRQSSPPILALNARVTSPSPVVPIDVIKQWNGNIVDWEGPDDPKTPMNWSRAKKTRTTLLYGLTTMCATFASSIFAASSPYIAQRYGKSQEVTLLGLSLFLLGFAIGPLAFAPSSEIYGRKVTLLAPMFVFACFSVGTATAANFQTILLTRFFGGVFASSPVTIVGGGMADIWNQRERGSAIAVYSLCVVGGPTISPVIGAAISASYLTWRWTEYLCCIMTCAVLLVDLFLLEETSAAVLLARKARRLRLDTGNWALHASAEEQDHSISVFLHKLLFLPLEMMIKEPMVLLIVTYNGFVYGILYLLFATIPIIFGDIRGWSVVVASLPNLATLIGTIIGTAINGAYAEHFFARYLDRHDGNAPPERRLPPMMIGGVCFPIGFFLVGWTSFDHVHWFPSCLGLTLIGMSFLLIFQAGMNYMIDGYTKVAVSATAANNIQRSLYSAALPLAAQPLFNNLGVHWACTLLGGIAVVLGCIPFFFLKYGESLRRRSRFARTSH